MMVDERLMRARAEAEAEELRDEAGRLQDERLRLSRRNERLTSLLLELRADSASSEGMQQRIDEALDYDGRDAPLDLDQYAPHEDEPGED